MSTMPRSTQSYSRSSSVRHRDNFLPFALGDTNQSSPDEGSNSDESPSRRHSIEDEQVAKTTKLIFEQDMCSVSTE